MGITIPQSRKIPSPRHCLSWGLLLCSLSALLVAFTVALLTYSISVFIMEDLELPGMRTALMAASRSVLLGFVSLNKPVFFPSVPQSDNARPVCWKGWFRLLFMLGAVTKNNT